jgi:hypothetical protein
VLARQLRVRAAAHECCDAVSWSRGFYGGSRAAMSPSLMRPCHRSVRVEVPSTLNRCHRCSERSPDGGATGRCIAASARVASENNGTIENDMARDERNEPAQGCAETGRYNSKYAPASGLGVVSPTLAAPINYSEQFSHFLANCEPSLGIVIPGLF